MAETGKVYVGQQVKGSHKEDRQLLDQIFRKRRVSDADWTIMPGVDLEALIELIVEQTIELLGAGRCTVFIHDDRSGQLWSIVGTGLEKSTIKIPSSAGIAGWVFTNRQPLIINDAYSDARFCRDVDKSTGFTTHNILCIPLVNRSDVCIGSLQVLNKSSGDFTDNDQLLLSTVSQYITVALENGLLYESLKAISEARKKVIDHLSHELRTPIAIIDSALAIILRKVRDEDYSDLDKPLARCKRNLKRLLGMQEKTIDILNYRYNDDQAARLIETVCSLTEEICEEDQTAYAAVAQKLLRRLKSIHEIGEFSPEPILISAFLNAVCDQAFARMQPRALNLIRHIEPGLMLVFDKTVLQKTCAGLLKNAIEATPDEGMIRVAASKSDDGVTIAFQDWGVGITTDNQRNLFTGFCHTQDTAYYASKYPYAFCAGGSGLDLLRIKAFSERFGFKLSFVSQGCRHITDDSTMCSGAVSACRFIGSLADCIAAGGSTFTLHFPVAGFSAPDRRHAKGGSIF